MPELRQLGWFDLLQGNWPQTEIPSRLAFEALWQLAIDEAGSWNGNPAVVVGVVTFLKQATGKFPSAIELKDLKAMLASRPVDNRGVEEWFTRVYGR